jgi:hypothetical protein
MFDIAYEGVASIGKLEVGMIEHRYFLFFYLSSLKLLQAKYFLHYVS